jgi:hypothetical protein
MLLERPNKGDLYTVTTVGLLIMGMLLGAVGLVAQVVSSRVEVDHKVYEVIYFPAPACQSFYSGDNRECIPHLHTTDELVWVKVVQLNRTPVRDWGPNSDSWSIGVIRASRSERPVDMVRSVIDKQQYRK